MIKSTLVFIHSEGKVVLFNLCHREVSLNYSKEI